MKKARLALRRRPATPCTCSRAQPRALRSRARAHPGDAAPAVPAPSPCSPRSMSPARRLASSAPPPPAARPARIARSPARRAALLLASARDSREVPSPGGVGRGGAARPRRGAPSRGVTQPPDPADLCARPRRRGGRCPARRAGPAGSPLEELRRREGGAGWRGGGSHRGGGVRSARQPARRWRPALKLFIKSKVSSEAAKLPFLCLRAPLLLRTYPVENTGRLLRNANGSLLR